MKTLIFAFALIALAGCGEPWNGIDGVYSGTTTETVTANNNTTTYTYTGSNVSIQSASQGGKVVVSTAQGAITATLNGSALVFDSSTMGSMDSSAGATNTTTTISSGSGTATGTTLNFTLTGTITLSGGSTGNGALSLAYTGTKL